MLIPLDQIQSFLRPIGGDSAASESIRTMGGNQQAGYADTILEVDGKPVLIDFDRSLVQRERLVAARGESLVIRRKYGPLRRCLKWAVQSDKSATRRAIRQMIELLRSQSGRPRVLVIGGGTIGQGVEELYSSLEIELVACDIYASPHVQLIADAHQLPFVDSCFDGVIIQAVLEHVIEPQVVVGEIARVLRQGGLVYAETPFMQQVHEGPFDFTRFTESGHRALFRDFEVVSSGPIGGVGTQLLWSGEYFVRGITRSRTVAKLVKAAFFFIKWFDHCAPMAHNIDAASGVYLLGRRSQNRMRIKDVIAYYQGAQK